MTEPSESIPPSGRARLWETLRHARRSQLVVAVLLALLGFGGVTQVRTSEADSSYTGYREQDLIDVFSGLGEATQRAQSELTRLEQRRDELQSSTQRRQAALDEAKTQVDTLAILAGVVPVTGPGIRITITEDSAEVDVDTFLDLVEELRSVGAEAIEVNDKVRLVAQSYLDQAEGGLVIDGTLLEPPYVVKAIGEPTTLKGAVTFLSGPADELEEDGATVRVEEVGSLDITAVRGRDDGGSGSSSDTSGQ